MKRSTIWKIAGGIILILVIGVLLWNVGLHVYAVDAPITAQPSDCAGAAHGGIRFAVIGDFGEPGQSEADVAALVDSWGVDFIVTVGDNNYPDGEASTIDENIGQYYQAYIHPYEGRYGPGAAENRFFPALGNHDWDTGTVQPYLDYFALPGNGRYYDFEKGPVHFFVLDSDPREPDGRSRDSVQADWLQDKMDEDDAPWRLVVLHHPPYSSSLMRGENAEMQWPFARWGASAILGGHEHLYERAYVDGIPQFVVGLSGKWKGINPIHRFAPWSIPGSRVRYNRDYGALLVTADELCINFGFYVRSGELIDSYTMIKEEAP